MTKLKLEIEGVGTFEAVELEGLPDFESISWPISEDLEQLGFRAIRRCYEEQRYTELTDGEKLGIALAAGIKIEQGEAARFAKNIRAIAYKDGRVVILNEDGFNIRP